VRLNPSGGPSTLHQRPHRSPRSPNRFDGLRTAARLVTQVGAWSLALSLVLTARTSSAQYPRDRSANQQITAIISGLYAKQRFAEAEEALLGVIRACGGECSPAMLARAWMYAGIAEGTGMGDQRAARESFDNAIDQDENISIDMALADPATVATFTTARHDDRKREQTAPQLGIPSRSDPKRAASADRAPAPIRSGLTCTPSAREIQTRRPIPFECRADDQTERVSLRYREHPEAPWQTLELERDGSSFRATLACDVTMNSGRLELFIVATDGAGDPIDTLGTKSAPIELVLNPASPVAPAYPGEEPPARCAERVICPPDFPGCADAAADETAEGVARPRQPRHWASLHFAADVGFVGGSNVCTSNNADYDCFTSGTDTPFPGVLGDGVAARPGELGDGYPGTDIPTGVASGTLRVLLGYDHALNERVSIGGRLGYAFGGSPTTLDGDSFLPVHIEARLAYWPRGLWAAGVRPSAHIGAGLAEVDLKEGDLSVRDCTEETGRQSFLDCLSAVNAYDPANNPELPTRRLDAFRKLGNAFVAVGGGLTLPLGGGVAAQVNVNALLMLPSVGVVIQPSLGVTYGF
jgi:hypothetical protein